MLTLQTREEVGKNTSKCRRLNKRRGMDLQISNILDSNFSCIPLIMGDMGMPHFLKAINLVTNLTPMITCTGSL